MATAAAAVAVAEFWSFTLLGVLGMRMVQLINLAML
jgi:hypothetical protein